MAWWLLQTAWLGDGIWNRAHFGHPKVGSIPWCWLVQRQAHAYRLPLRLKHRLRSSPKGLHCNWSMSVTKRIPAVTTLRSRAFYGNWTTRCPVTCPNWCWKTNGDGPGRSWVGAEPDEAWTKHGDRRCVETRQRGVRRAAAKALVHGCPTRSEGIIATL
jgi:hypothetical protein